MWNVTAKILQKKYFNEFGVCFNPFSDIEFKQARDAGDMKIKELQKIPAKRTHSALPFSVNEKIRMQELYDENTPDGLQKKFYFVISIELAWRGGEGVQALTDFFTFETDNKCFIMSNYKVMNYLKVTKVIF